MSGVVRRHSFKHKLSGQVYLWLAVLIFGAASPITRKLTELGAQKFIGGENPISFCNVLFVGNLCALAVMLLIYRRQWNWKTLRRFTNQEWLGLTAVAVLAGALAPALIFQALSITSVNNVVLIGRLDPPLTLALSVWLLGERVNRWDIGCAIAVVSGVALIILLQPLNATMGVGHGLGVGLGELLAAAGAVTLAIAAIIGRKYLGHVPPSFLNLFRTALGTVVFFCLALLLYGQDHFMAAFSPFLWEWMLVYGAVIVVGGQSFWLWGLRLSSLATASLVGSFLPIASMVAAYLVLEEVPTPAQYFGGSLILAGIALAELGMQRQRFREALTLQQNRSDRSSQSCTLEMGMGFKGI